MLSAEESRIRLENLLQRVRRNRVRIATERDAAIRKAESAELSITGDPLPLESPAPLIASVPDIAAVHKQAIEIEEPAHEAALRIPKEPSPEPFQAPARLAAMPSRLEEVEPEIAPIPQAASREKETRSFETEPVLSGEVAEVHGEIAPVKWTLEAVLERAWKLGQ